MHRDRTGSCFCTFFSLLFPSLLHFAQSLSPELWEHAHTLLCRACQFICSAKSTGFAFLKTKTLRLKSQSISLTINVWHLFASSCLISVTGSFQLSDTQNNRPMSCCHPTCLAGTQHTLSTLLMSQSTWHKRILAPAISAVTTKPHRLCHSSSSLHWSLTFYPLPRQSIKPHSINLSLTLLWSHARKSCQIPAGHVLSCHHLPTTTFLNQAPSCGQCMESSVFHYSISASPPCISDVATRAIF